MINLSGAEKQCTDSELHHGWESVTLADLQLSMIFVILYLLLEGGTVEESPAAPWPSPLPSQEGRGPMLVLVTLQVRNPRPLVSLAR